MVKLQFFLPLILSYIIPLTIFGVLIAFKLDVYPFGGNTLLISDMSHQYIQYYAYLYDVFQGKKSLLYSWEAGMGLNALGIYAYYLASPLSLLILLFDRTNLPEAIVLITLVKIGLAGLSMYFYLSKITQKEISALPFSIIYALMSYTIVYSFNIMWLDGIYLLPLLLYGIEKLVKSGDFVVFTVSLIMLFISNFYISYMVGLFAFLYFLLRFLLICKGHNMKVFIKKFSLFIFFTFLAAGISAIMTVPTFLALRSNYVNDSFNIIDHTFTFNLLDFYSRLFNGVYDSIVNGLPTIYVGILPLLLYPLFFFIKEISIKEKFLWGTLLLFLVISFEIPLLNLTWHGFDSPNWFPHRFAFVFSFMLIYLAFKVYLVLDRKNVSLLFISFLVHLFILFVLEKVSPTFISLKHISLNFVLLTLFFSILVVKIYYLSRKILLLICLLIVVSFDMSKNTLTMLHGVNSQLTYKSRAEYNMINPNYSNMLRLLETIDEDFYRLELNRYRTLNDPMRYDYKGIPHFSSMSNISLHSFLNDIGYTTLSNYFWVSKNGGTLITDSLFGIKYNISDASIDKFGYHETESIENVGLYRNEYFLPLGFMVDKTQDNLNRNNPFDLQNNMFGPDIYFTKLEPISAKYENLNVIEHSNMLYLKKIDNSQETYIDLKVEVMEPIQLYSIIDMEKLVKTEIFVNDTPMGAYSHVHHNRIVDLGYIENPNKYTSIRIKILGNEIKISELSLYALDISKYKQRIEKLRKQPFIVNNYTNTSVSGTIDVIEDGVLFLSIPFDKGWSARINGAKTDLTNLDAFLGLELKHGTYNIDLTYSPPGFKAGIMISSICILLFLSMSIIRYRENKFQKKEMVIPYRKGED